MQINLDTAEGQVALAESTPGEGHPRIAPPCLCRVRPRVCVGGRDRSAVPTLGGPGSVTSARMHVLRWAFGPAVVLLVSPAWPRSSRENLPQHWRPGWRRSWSGGKGQASPRTRMCDRIQLMLRRPLTVLLFVYIALELANPCMPGAVTFEGGAMHTAENSRCTIQAASAPLPASASPVGQMPTVVPTLPFPPVPDQRRAATPPSRLRLAPRRRSNQPHPP